MCEISKKDKISIIIPIYNQEKFLNQCVDSVLCQTYSNLQVILVDDGSTDGSFLICNNYKEKDERVETYTIENQGVSTARNFGLEKAVGDWIMYVDADDWMEIDACEKLLETAICEDADIVDGSVIKEFKNKSIRSSLGDDTVRLIAEGKEEAKKLVDEVFFYKKNRENNITLLAPYSKLVRKELIDNNKISFLNNLSLGEDQLHNIDLFLASKKHVWRDCIVYHYRIHSQSQTRNKEKEVFKKRALYLQELYKKKSFDLPEYVWDIRVMKGFLLCLNTVKFKNYDDFKSTVTYYSKLDIFKQSLDRMKRDIDKYNITGKLARPMSHDIVYEHYFRPWILLNIRKVIVRFLGRSPS